MIYTACKYAPEELFAGFSEPVTRLDPATGSFSLCENCASPHLCGFAKSLIETVLSHHISRLVLTDCCDSMRRTYDVLQASGKLEFLYFLPLPHNDTESEISLFRKNLLDLTDRYAQFSGVAFSPRKAIEACRSSALSLPDRPYIALTGAHGSSFLQEEIRKIFSPETPLVNFTCTGTRNLRLPDSLSEPLFDWYPRALLTQLYPCMRMRWRQPGVSHTDHNVVGTIEHTIKFCDYYSFDYLERKKDSTVPLLKIETDGTTGSVGPLITRLEAFRETVLPDKAKEKRINMSSQKSIYVAGIDSGSASTDAIIMDADHNILTSVVLPTGAGAKSGAEKALDLVLQQAHLDRQDLSAIVSTGYGRHTIGSDESVTEITCHARGAHFLYPDARTVIDIGGQDSKVIRIDDQGHVMNFAMNDKCAAGTGRFLETQARALGLSLSDMSERGLKGKNTVTISNMCTVFAESEVVSLIAENTPVEDIIRGLNEAVAKKTVGLLNRISSEPEFMMTGGVARNQGVVQCLEEQLQHSVYVSDLSQLAGAIGAALIALDSIIKTA